MFEIDGDATTAQILDSAAGLARARIELDNAVLLHAVAWADRNGPATIHPDQLAIRGGNRPVQLGGDGTPEVGDLAPAELGAVLGMSAGAASSLVADSLDLRPPAAQTMGQNLRLLVSGLAGAQNRQRNPEPHRATGCAGRTAAR